MMEINVEKCFVSIRILDFKDNEEERYCVQAARMSFLYDISYLFYIHSPRPCVFLLTWLVAQ